jgi:hypothetical protein
LSASAQHAVQTIQIALRQGDPTVTAREIRLYVGRLYGSAIDQELKLHFAPNATLTGGLPAKED